MFPLGSVLFPGVAVTLQIFEPRYRRLLADCLADDATFGVVLIERGSEVGGGDTRFGVGTTARIDHHEPLAQGRHLVVAEGATRIRVDEWLPDDPYPRALISGWPDEPDGDREATLARYAACTTRLRRFLAVAAELGHRVPPATFEVSDDPSEGSHQLCALAPVGALDRQRLLECPGPDERLALLETHIDEQLALAGID